MMIDVGSRAAGRKRPAPGMSPYPPIADYAFLSDCEANCLIAPSGQVEWMCLPRHDSPSAFSTMLDRAAGGFKVAPYGVREPTARRYLPGSLIMETTWQTRTGWMIVRDALVMGPWHHAETRARRYRRPPTNYEAEHCLLRTVRCVSGSVESVLCEPVFDYGRRRARWEFVSPGYGEARTLSSDEADPVLRLTTDRRLGIEDSIAVIRSRMTEGEEAFIALSWTSF